MPLEAPLKIEEIRRANLRRLMEKETATAISKRLGYRFPSYLSQLAGPNPTREITEKTARRFEKDLGLSEGALDKAPNAAPPAAPTAQVSPDLTALIGDVIRLVGSVCAQEEVDLPTPKLADVVALAFADTMDHGGKPREAHVRQVVRLLK